MEFVHLMKVPRRDEMRYVPILLPKTKFHTKSLVDHPQRYRGLLVMVQYHDPILGMDRVGNYRLDEVLNYPPSRVA